MISLSTTNSMFQIMKFMIMMYVINKNHTLTNLIMIEFVSIAATVVALKTMTYMDMEMYMIMFMLIIFITESIVGLSALINMMRTHSNDYLKSSTMLKF